jgi:hypothetical protein
MGKEPGENYEEIRIHEPLLENLLPLSRDMHGFGPTINIEDTK